MVKITKLGSGVTIKEASIGRKESSHFSYSKLNISYFVTYGSNNESSEPFFFVIEISWWLISLPSKNSLKDFCWDRTPIPVFHKYIRFYLVQKGG